MYWVYMVKNKANNLYIGMTDNPERRLNEHNSKRGAHMTESGGFTFVFLEQSDSRLEARKREVQIKKWRREKKEVLVQRYFQGLETKL